tara:strand:+ start:657 stop:848 length:192 start_codon:yes stop_codon:yes gene_type:complete
MPISLGRDRGRSQAIKWITHQNVAADGLIETCFELADMSTNARLRETVEVERITPLGSKITRD